MRAKIAPAVEFNRSCTDLLVISAPVGLPPLAGIGIDLQVLAFCLVVSVVTGLAFSIAPIVLRTFLSERFWASLASGKSNTRHTHSRPAPSATSARRPAPGGFYDGAPTALEERQPGSKSTAGTTAITS